MAKILIAEDEKDIRDLIVFALEVSGHQVIAASNGQQALEQAAVTLPDLIMLDMRMPVLGGLDACHELKAHPDLAHIPVVFLSGNESDEEFQAAQDAGAIDFIAKPFDPMGLKDRVDTILGQAGVV